MKKRKIKFTLRFILVQLQLFTVNSMETLNRIMYKLHFKKKFYSWVLLSVNVSAINFTVYMHISSCIPTHKKGNTLCHMMLEERVLI